MNAAPQLSIVLKQFSFGVTRTSIVHAHAMLSVSEASKNDNVRSLGKKKEVAVEKRTAAASMIISKLEQFTLGTECLHHA